MDAIHGIGATTDSLNWTDRELGAKLFVVTVASQWYAVPSLTSIPTHRHSFTSADTRRA